MNFKMKPTISFARVLTVLQDHGVKVVRSIYTSRLIRRGRKKSYFYLFELFVTA